MTKRTVSAGTKQSYFGLVDDNGFLKGSSATAPANGASSPMLRLRGIQTATPGVQEPEDVDIEGDDGVDATITFEATTLPSFVAGFSQHDLETDALMQETAVETLGDYDFGVLQPEDPGRPNGTLIVQGQSVSKDDANAGLAVWSGFILPLVTAVPLGRETFEGRTPASNRIKFSAQKASKKPWGVTIASGDLGTTAAPIIPFSGPHPLLMHRITGNGSTDTFTLPKAVAGLNSVFAFEETALLSHGSGLTATVGSTSLVFDSAPAAGARVVVLYGFTP